MTKKFSFKKLKIEEKCTWKIEIISFKREKGAREEIKIERAMKKRAYEEKEIKKKKASRRKMPFA